MIPQEPLDLEPGQKIFYRKGKYIFRGKHLEDKHFAYAEHEKTGIIKKINLKRVIIRDENKAD